MKRCALIAVHHKDDRILDFCTRLIGCGWDVVATPGTSAFLRRGGLECRSIEQLIGVSRLGDKVVTLAREVHEALLCDESDTAQSDDDGHLIFSLAAVEMFPLESLMLAPELSPEQLLHSVDVGGAALIRSAVKGNRIILADLDDCESVVNWVEGSCPDRDIVCTRLQVKAEMTVAQSCFASALYRRALNINSSALNRV
jgi:AICAR transformylase/IMP cyclohydrolase PurH